MSTWEERMSARAQERIRAEWEREQEQIRAEIAAEEAEMEERYRPVREAGPPGGCHECWSWVRSYWPDGFQWAHGESIQPGRPPDYALGVYPGWREPEGTDWCWHACHEGEPVCCIPVAMAAAG